MPDPRGRALSWMMALPSCPKCGNRMSLVLIFFRDNGTDERTYECEHCGHEAFEVIYSKEIKEAS
jgi:Zn ribbon nucleic-acid-binding protein